MSADRTPAPVPPAAPTPVADLIEYAAGIIAAKSKEPHTAPYHWAAALWEAGMLHPPGQIADCDAAAYDRGVAAGRTAAAADIRRTHETWARTGKLPQSYLDGVADAAGIADEHAEGTDHAG